MSITSTVNCNDCIASKYAGFFTGVTEYCLLHKQYLNSTNLTHTPPCNECGGKDFVQDTWDE